MARAPLKVLAIVPSGFCFGLQNAELALFAALKNRMQCHFLTTRWSDGEFVRRLDELGIAHSSTWLGMFSRRLDWPNIKMTAECLLRLPLAWRDFIRTCRSFRPDVIYIANHHEAILLAPLLFWMRRKVVCHMHDPPPAIGFQRVSAQVWRRCVGRMIFVSQSVRERFAQIAPVGTADVVVHNGVNVAPLVLPRNRSDRFCRRFDWSGNSVIFGMTGQIGEHKGHEDFIEAAAIVRQTEPNARFVIGGRGPAGCLARLRRLIAERSLDDYVKICGWLPDAAEFYEAIDVLVLASRHDEGFGLVVAEAGERGLPVVATRAGGAVEVVVDKVGGILVDRRAPRELAGAMTLLSADPELRDRMGRNARDRVERSFDLATQAGLIADCLERMNAEYGERTASAGAMPTSVR